MIRNLLAAIVLLALVSSYFFYSNLFGVRPVLVSVVYPFQYATNVVWGSVAGTPSFLIKLGNLAKENAELRRKLNMAQSRLAVLEEIKIENERLRETLAFQKGRYNFKLVPAQVIGKSGVLLLDRGSRVGVRVGMPVMVKEGLVGRIVEAAPFSSKVLLITDAMSSVAAADQRSRDFGVVEGGPADTLSLKYVAGSGGVGQGDTIVTSSISSVFSPGIPIGTVTRAVKKEADLFYEITVKPSVDFSKLEEVFIVF